MLSSYAALEHTEATHLLTSTWVLCAAVLLLTFLMVTVFTPD